jgi:hypothetical protein
MPNSSSTKCVAQGRRVGSKALAWFPKAMVSNHFSAPNYCLTANPGTLNLRSRPHLHSCYGNSYLYFCTCASYYVGILVTFRADQIRSNLGQIWH